MQLRVREEKTYIIGSDHILRGKRREREKREQNGNEVKMQGLSSCTHIAMGNVSSQSEERMRRKWKRKGKRWRKPRERERWRTGRWRRRKWCQEEEEEEAEVKKGGWEKIKTSEERWRTGRRRRRE